MENENYWENYDVLKLETWTNKFSLKELNLDKLREYLDFIVQAVKRYDSNQYSEWHHVMPKCVDKDHEFDNEGVRINGSDHFRAHLKLVECFNGIKKRNLGFALVRMKNNSLAPEEYEIIKKNYSKLMRGSMNSFYGKKHTEESRKKMSESSKGKCAGEKNGMYGKPNPRRGVSLSEETRKKISEANTGKVRSEELRQYFSRKYSGERNPMYGRRGPDNPNYGLQRSEETRQKISKARIGTHLSDNTKKLLSIVNTGSNNPSYGKHWITNGTENKYINKDDPIPDGWRYGRTLRKKVH